MQERFCPHDAPDAAAKLLAYVLLGEGEFERYEPSQADERPKVLVDIAGVPAEELHAKLEERFDDAGLARNHYYVTFRRERDDAPQIVAELGPGIGYHAIGGSLAKSLPERWWYHWYARGKLHGGAAMRHLDFMFEREWQRRFGFSDFDEVVALGTPGKLTQGLFAWWRLRHAAATAQ